MSRDECDLLLSSAKRGNKAAVNSLLQWTRATAEMDDDEVTLRQTLAITGLLTLLEHNKQKFRTWIEEAKGRRFLEIMLKSPVNTIADTTAKVLDILNDGLSNVAVDVPNDGSWTELQTPKPEPFSASLEAKAKPELSSDTLSWIDDNNYDLDEILDFKSDWDMIDVDRSGLPLDDFITYIISQFTSVDRTLLRDLKKRDLGGQNFTFQDFLVYMDQYESITDSETDSEEEEESGVIANEAFYLGDQQSQPHCLLRAFTSPDADFPALMAPLMPTEDDFKLVFEADVCARVQQRCRTAWQQELATCIAPRHAGQKQVGVYVIRDEYKQLWAALAPLLQPGVVAFGFDFNVAEADCADVGKFSSRGSYSNAMLVETQPGVWKYFPAKFICMRDDDWARLLQPPLLPLRRMTRKILTGNDLSVCSFGGVSSFSNGSELPRFATDDSTLDYQAMVANLALSLVPTDNDWRTLLCNDPTLAERCIGEYAAQRQQHNGPVQISRLASLPFGTARYYAIEYTAMTAADFGRAEPAIRRNARRFPRGTARLAAAMAPTQLLCCVRLAHGAMCQPLDRTARAPAYAADDYDCDQGEHAPAKNCAFLAHVGGRWQLYPRAVLLAHTPLPRGILAQQPTASRADDDSLSDVHFSDTESESEQWPDDRYRGVLGRARDAPIDGLAPNDALANNALANGNWRSGRLLADEAAQIEAAADNSWCVVQ